MAKKKAVTSRRTPAARPPAGAKPLTVERHAEVIRQWQLLRQVESTKYGKTVDELAATLGVTTRTIRRDIDALTLAGFPLESAKHDGGTRYVLNREIHRGLVEAGLSLPELCALYFSRTLTQFMAGMPFDRDLETAFDKLEDVLTPRMKQYLDAMSGVFAAKALPVKKPGKQQAAVVSSLYAAIFQHRRVRMTYYSFHSRRESEYVVEPNRLAFAEGGLYLFAFVPAYGGMRTFAVERIRGAALTDERFDPTASTSAEAFGESIGVNSGRPEPVVIRFTGEAAPHVVEREWHRTQKIEQHADGSVVVRLTVCVDFALQAWILSFGPLAQVLAPTRLAERVYEQLEEARDQYAPRLFTAERAARPAAHPTLPFKGGTRRSSSTRPS